MEGHGHDHTAPATASAQPPASDPIWRERHERSHATRLALLVAAGDHFYSPLRGGHARVRAEHPAEDTWGG